MKKILILLAFVIVGMACKEDNTNEAPSIIVPGTENLKPAFSSAGGNATISFTASKEWTASVMETRSIGWCKIEPNNGRAGKAQISITTIPNDSQEVRSATITINCGSVNQSILVTQKGKSSQEPTFTLSKKSERVSSSAGQLIISIKTNSAPWNITDISPWLKVSPEKGDNDTVITISYTENTETEEREGTVCFAAGDYMEKFTVKQSAANTAISITPSIQEVKAAAGSFSIDINTNNIHWTTYGVPEWVELSESYATGNKRITVSYKKNTLNKKRSCEIYFKTESASQTLTIIQEAADAVISLNIYSQKVTNIAGSFDITVTTNEAPWETNISNNSWVTLSPPSGNGETKVKVRYSANTGYKERTEQVLFKSGEIIQVLNITQEATEIFYPEIALDITYKTVSAEKGYFEINVSSNADWHTENVSDWLSVNPSEKQLKDMSAGKIPVKIGYEANTKSNKRIGSVTFRTKEDGASATLRIEQEVKSIIGIYQGSINIGEEQATLILQFAKNNVAKLTIKGDGETETMTGTWEQNEENIKATFHIDDAIIAINGMLDENYQQIYSSLDYSDPEDKVSLPLKLSRID